MVHLRVKELRQLNSLKYFGRLKDRFPYYFRELNILTEEDIKNYKKLN